MKLLCIVVIAGIQQGMECDLISETVGGWSASCQGQIMQLPEFRCAYADGSPKRALVGPEHDYSTLPEDPWLK